MRRTMDVTERFMAYIALDTTSDENSPSCPSTERQWTLARLLEKDWNSPFQRK